MIAPLDDLPLVRRIVLTFIIILIVLFLLSFIGWISGGWDDAHGEQAQTLRTEPHLVFLLPPSRWDFKLVDLDRQALDTAYMKKIEQLFSVWVSDDTGQPERAAKGALHAKRAYIEAQRALDMREQMIIERERGETK